MSLKVLVTGAAGYIGHVLCDTYRAAGHEVHGLDRCFFGPMPEGLAGSIVADIRDVREDDLRGFDVISHLAGLSNDPTAEYNPEANWQINALATERLAEMARSAGIGRFIFASSASVYDNSDIGRGVVSENADISPRGAYSISKRYAEAAILGLGCESDFSPIVLRQGTVYGYSPRMRFDLVVNTFVKDALTTGKIRLHGGGWQWRPLIDVTDVALAHVRCAEAPRDLIHRQTFNVLEANYQIRAVAMFVAGSMLLNNIKVEIEDAPPPKLARDYRMSGAKMAEFLNFTPTTNPLQSVQKMLSKIRPDSEYLSDPKHYNIRWMTILEEVHAMQGRFASIY